MEIDARTISTSAEDEQLRALQQKGRKLGTTSFLQEFPAALMVQAEARLVPSLGVVAFQPLYTSLEVLRVLHTWLCSFLDVTFGEKIHQRILIESQDERERKLKLAGQQLRTRREGSVGAMFM